MISPPICEDCKYGVVTQLRRERGTQDPKRGIFCTLMKKEMEPDLLTCSQLDSFRSPVIFSSDAAPTPVILRDDDALDRTTGRMTGQILNGVLGVFMQVASQRSKKTK